MAWVEPDKLNQVLVTEVKSIEHSTGYCTLYIVQCTVQQCFPQDLKRLRWLKVVSKVRRTVEKSTPISAETRKSTPISAETRKEHSRLSRDQKKHSHLSRDQKSTPISAENRKSTPSQQRPEKSTPISEETRRSFKPLFKFGVWFCPAQV